VVVDLSIAAAAHEHPQRIALVIGEHEYSYAEVAARARSKHALVRDHHRLAVIAAPTLDAVATALAAVELGIPLVPLHSGSPSAERDLLRSRAGARFADAPALSRHECGPPRTEDELAVLFTSGSTGEPKGVVLSRRAFLASAAASAANLGWRDDDRWLCPLSWAHVGGLSVIVRCLIARRTAVLTEGPAGAETLTSALAHDITLASMVPAQLSALLEASTWKPPSSLRAILLGGAPSHPDLIDRAREREVPVLTTYGMSETCSQVATAPLAERPPAGAIGRPLPGIEVAVVDGEIVVDGPTLMSGYLSEPPLSGPLFTGDLGRLEDGWLFVDGRKDDRINSGGTRVDPLEVERVLAEVEGVGEACVFGIDDPTWGQLVCAAVVTTIPEIETLVSRIVDHCRTHLPSPKRPRRLAIVPSLALTGAGKLARRTIAAEVECDIRLRYSREIR